MSQAMGFRKMNTISGHLEVRLRNRFRKKKLIVSASFKPVFHSLTQRKPEYRLPWSWESPPFKFERGDLI